MKFRPWLLMLPLALGIGFLVGKQGSLTTQKAALTESASGRESRTGSRGARTDPFDGQSFSLTSMEDVRTLFKRYGSSVASAKLTLAVDSLSAAEIPVLMEMVQQEFKEDPYRYGTESYTLMSTLFERWAVIDPAASIAFVNSCKSRSFQKSAAASCFGALGKADPDRAVLEFQKLPKGEIRDAAGLQLISALADTDPAGACDLLEKETSPGGISEYYISNIFAEWAKSDPAAAAARLAKMPRERVGDGSAGRLAASWAQKDPEAALKWAKSLKGDSKSNSTSEVYKVLARTDAAAAWERLKGEPGHLRGKIVGGILGIVADESPQKAMAMLMSMGNKSEQRIATEGLLQQLSWSDTRLAFEMIEQVKDPATRRENLGNQMYYAAWMNPDLLKEQVLKLTDREKIDTSSSVLRGLMGFDPAAAEKYFLALPETQRTSQALSQMMDQYANLDPKKAFDFALGLKNPQEQTAAVTGLFDRWGREDPEAAAAGWKNLPTGQGRLEALDNIAGPWSESDPKAAKAWADTLTGSERTRALAAVLPALARDDPGSASRELGKLIAAPPDGMAQNLASSAGILAKRWADDDPAAASRWASALPQGPSRDAGLKAVSEAWCQYDTIATAGWLGTLQAGSSRDAAIEPLVDRVRETDPTTAFSWAASISDENNRLNQLRSTLKSWRNSDLRAARQAFDAAQLSDKERESLEKELD